MSKDTLIARYETLPVGPQKQVDIFIEFLSQTTTTTKSARSTGRRFKFDWADGLADLKSRFTAVELQHHLHLAAGLAKSLIDHAKFRVGRA